MSGPSLPSDCRRCGACCFSALATYVRVTGGDWERLGDDAARWAVFVGHRAFLRMEAGHCAALEIGRAADGSLRFACGIYERRPQICRDLDRGSPQCEAEIVRKAEGIGLVRDDGLGQSG